MSSDLMRQVGEQASRHDPWPLYAQLRQERVVRLEEHSYAVGRYDDVLALLHDPRVSSDPRTLTDPGDRQAGMAAFITRTRRVTTGCAGWPPGFSAPRTAPAW